MTVSNGVPDDITDAFSNYGGVLNFSQQYTIFGQIYDGMDVYDEICAMDVTDSETLRPSENIQFTKVYLSTYGENKNDSFFETQESTSAEDTSSQTESK